MAHLHSCATGKSLDQRQEAVLKVCQALWWEEFQAERNVICGKMGRAHPPFTRQTTNTQALLLLERGLSGSVTQTSKGSSQ